MGLDRAEARVWASVVFVTVLTSPAESFGRTGKASSWEGGRPVLRKERQEGEDQKLDVPVRGFFERNVTAAM